MNKSILSLIVTATALCANAATAQMDHGEMQMQGGSAPSDARDPHAYSGGYTLTEGPYAQQAPRQLKLADEHAFWSVLGDRLEYNESANSTVYDLQAWYGTTYNRFVVKAEGDIADGTIEESTTDLLWGHAFNAYFDTQLGIRLDQYDEGEDRQWLALGIQGLAPYWFELDTAAYIGDNGRTALTFEAEYELMLSQRLILQPRAEVNLYGKDDPDNGLGKGLSDLAIGLRLRYEFNRQFAPYVGVEWIDSYGNTADYRRASGKAVSDTQLVAGLRFWF
ncbi:copper resistance protein B [uncultured Gilvimarinus sp.]|uniref:copper resistance protein B n=1 Tax=uncultured Gilvimarinus sp. TaxID=1689143 RepID=UPI0030EDE17D|tara:strand:+ start:4433 stop:5266 length:834 start_codon:yes stop_codon:yes gene_type:complete